MNTVAVTPVISEQSFAQANKTNTYTFYVSPDANKMSVKEAIEAQYGVTVEKVNITIRKGKKVMTYKKRSRPVAAHRVNRKKAYVRLKSGDTIPVFEGAEG